jgi:cytoskeletal protein RodZ
MLPVPRTTFSLRRSSRASAVIAAVAVVLASVGGPLSQFVRLAEVVPATKATAAKAGPRYRVVWGAEVDAQPAQSGKKDTQKDGDQKERTPRIVKLLAGDWKAGSRVQVDSSALTPSEPVLVETLPAWAPIAEPVAVSYRVVVPRVPPARGPPAQA